jgi:hypothetical protein
VKFIYFGISYNNPCSPLSLSLLPAPCSPLQAHVLATSPLRGFRWGYRLHGIVNPIGYLTLYWYFLLCGQKIIMPHFSRPFKWSTGSKPSFHIKICWTNRYLGRLPGSTHYSTPSSDETTCEPRYSICMNSPPPSIFQTNEVTRFMEQCGILCIEQRTVDLPFSWPILCFYNDKPSEWWDIEEKLQEQAEADRIAEDQCTTTEDPPSSPSPLFSDHTWFPSRFFAVGSSHFILTWDPCCTSSSHPHPLSSGFVLQHQNGVTRKCRPKIIVNKKTFKRSCFKRYPSLHFYLPSNKGDHPAPNYSLSSDKIEKIKEFIESCGILSIGHS